MADDEFSRTIQRVRSVEHARRERGASDRRSWFRRKEDVLEDMRRARAERRREIRDWLLLAVVVVSLLLGNLDIASQALGGF